MNERLQEMIEQLDVSHEVQLGSIVTNLLKIQRAEQRIAKKADATIEKLRKSDPQIAEHIKENHVRCSFCGKWSNEVELVVAGPGEVYICNECVYLCINIMDEEKKGIWLRANQWNAEQ